MLFTIVANGNSFDYIFQLAVEMAKLGIPWTKEAKS
jgi:hypothetical protein